MIKKSEDNNQDIEVNKNKQKDEDNKIIKTGGT